MAAPTYDPQSAQARLDPYPLYRGLRELDPVQHVPSAGLWFLSRHADCLAVLRDPRFSAQHGQQVRLRRSALPVSMLNTDPPRHTLLRAAVAPAFDVAAMDRARPWVQSAIDNRLGPLCERLDSGEEVDVVGSLARPLAAQVLARFLGLAQGELPDFVAWGTAVAANLDPFADPDPAGPAAAAMAQMLDRFADHLHARASAPSQDAFTVLARSHTDGALSAGEVLSAAALIVVGGLDPLADLIGNAVAALLTAPLVWPAARVPRTAAEELLRFDPPIQFTARTALRDVMLGDRQLRRGDSVIALLGAANRDPARFPSPERLLLNRRTNPHLSFGAGPHVCLGARLVRLVCGLLADRAWTTLPALRPGTVAAVHRGGVVPRGYQRLPVRLA